MDEDQEQQLAFAEPILRSLYDGWQAAADRYAEYDEKHTAEHDDTTAAMCVRAHMFYEVKRRFDDQPSQPGCKVRNVRGLKVLLFRDKQVWRFKKVNAAGRHSNYPTQQQADFDDEWPLPGIPEQAVRLTSGYILDAVGKSIERIVVARVLGRDVLWVAQTSIVDDQIQVKDITPSRFAGTERSDFDAERAQANRRKK